MEQPKGFVAFGQEHLVCRLRKSVYHLKKATRQWYKKFDDFIQSVGFSKSDKDHCLVEYECIMTIITLSLWIAQVWAISINSVKSICPKLVTT